MRTNTKILAGAAFIAATAFPVSTAVAVTVVERIESTVQTQVNTCNGETVEMGGTQTRLRHDDGTGQVTVHLTGTTDQGNRYVLNARATFQNNIRTVDSVLVSQGAAPNQDVEVFFVSNSGISIEATECRP